MNLQTLHLLRQSPYQSNDFVLCLELVTAADSVVLLDDGCYTLASNKIDQLLAITKNVYVIKEHSEARALNTNPLVKAIPLKEINTMLFQHHNSVTWQ